MAGLEWYPCDSLKLATHHQELATFLLYHHIGCVFLFRRVLEFRCGWVGVMSV